MRDITPQPAAAGTPQDEHVRTDGSPAPRKPYAAPALQQQGSLTIQAGSVNLWVRS